MKTFQINCSDQDIREAVVDWSELLAQGRYNEALSMFLHTSESFNFQWTAEHLEDWITNYGCARKDYNSGEYRKVTSVYDQPNSDAFINKAVQVDRRNLFGLNPREYVGMVHYNDVPLDGEQSDLTARFHIKKVGVDIITLEFLDIHVM